MVSRGCTLAAWYFGFPQQQQWTQDSAIMKRKVATNRMSTKKAPSSSGLACGRSCSLIHTFSRISRTSSLISMLTLRRRSHKGEICFSFREGKALHLSSECVQLHHESVSVSTSKLLCVRGTKLCCTQKRPHDVSQTSAPSSCFHPPPLLTPLIRFSCLWCLLVSGSSSN